jgi:hypothetical protein
MLVDDGAVLGLRHFAQVNHRPVQPAVAASPNLSFGFGATLSRRARRAASSSRSLRAVRIPLSTVRHLDALFTYTCV